MTETYFTAAQHRRRARWITALVIILALGIPLAVIVSDAQASYNHAPACAASLAGHSGSDNDIAKTTRRIGASRFLGWQINIHARLVSWHGPDGSVYLRGTFGFPDGHWRTLVGHCYGGDYHGDHFHV